MTLDPLRYTLSHVYHTISPKHIFMSICPKITLGDPELATSSIWSRSGFSLLEPPPYELHRGSLPPQTSSRAFYESSLTTHVSRRHREHRLHALLTFAQSAILDCRPLRFFTSIHRQIQDWGTPFFKFSKSNGQLSPETLTVLVTGEP